MSRPLVRSSAYSFLETTEFISVQFILGSSTLNKCVQNYFIAYSAQLELPGDS